MQGQIEAVLVCCKHYDSILNFHYKTYDDITEKLISTYQEYLFQIDGEDAKQLHMAKQLDQVMYVYVTSSSFYRFVQNYYRKDTSIPFGDITDVIALYHDYIKDEIKSTKITKWI